MKKYSVFIVCFLLMFSFLFLVDAKGKEPVLSSLRWGDDVRIAEWDSVNVVVFDVDSSTGNLFAALNSTYGGTGVLTVHISVDTGKTWSQITSVGWDAVDIDAAVFKDYFYVAHVTGSAVFIGRYNTSDGTADNSYGYRSVFNEGVSVRKIALASTEDFSPPTRLYCFAITDDDTLRYYWSDTSVTSWSTFNLGIGNASRGLDACCNEGYSSEYAWCSYIGTNDSVYIGSVGATWNSYGPLTDVYYSVSGMSITSIGAYRDTIMVLYPYCGGEFAYFVNSCASYDGGGNWEYEGTLFGPSGATWGASAITARRGAGFGAVITCSNFGVFRQRGYPAGDWSDTVHFTNHLVDPRIKPAIERIAANSYGILYVDYPTKGAWFDISQWPESGIEENSPGENETSLLEATPSVFSSRTSIEYILSSQQNISLDVYDVLGNHVINLISGEVPAGKNSTAWDGKNASGNPVASGVYVCVLKSNEKSTASTKITMIK